MEELTVQVKTAKDAALVKIFLEKKFKGIKVASAKNGFGKIKSYGLLEEPKTKNEMLELIKVARQESKEGMSNSMKELKRSERQWLKEK